jgi:ribosomal protein L32
MTDTHDNHNDEMTCSCGELHKGHICWLSKMGLLAEVKHLTSAPTVSCAKCGARANLPHNVCFPAAAEK